MVTVYYDPAYTAAGFAFPTTRKAGWIASSLSEQPIPGINLEQPTPLTEESLSKAHDIKYIQSVRTGKPKFLAESSGLTWDSGLSRTPRTTCPPSQNGSRAHKPSGSGCACTTLGWTLTRIARWEHWSESRIGFSESEKNWCSIGVVRRGCRSPS